MIVAMSDPMVKVFSSQKIFPFQNSNLVDRAYVVTTNIAPMILIVNVSGASGKGLIGAPACFCRCLATP